MSIYDAEDNQQFWAQIHELLLPYARTHLIVDHAEYTKRAVEELLLHTLTCVPIADATSFLLPTDPFDALIRYLDSLKPKPFEERLVVAQDAVDFIKNTFSPPSPLWELITERCWHLEDCEYKKRFEVYKPMSPILTQQARRETPILGGKKALATTPHTRFSLKSYLFPNLLHDEVVADPPLPQSCEVVDVRYQLQASSQVELRSLVQSIFEPVPFVDEYSGSFTNVPNAASFLMSESPTRYSRLESPPLFARAGRATKERGHKNTDQGALAINFVADVAPLLKRASAELMEGEGDMNGHHMQVIDGWTTYTLSSPPSYRPRSPSSGEVDELWEISRPGTPATSLAVAKMEDIEIPRTRKFGYGCQNREDGASAYGIPNAFVTAKSPASFITSFIPTVPVSMSLPETAMSKAGLFTHSQPGAFNSLNTSLPTIRSPSSSATNSLRGQPPTAISMQENGATSGMEVDLDTTLMKVYSSYPRDPLSYILEERLDVKEIMLMDVPCLPSPIAHLKESAFDLYRMSSLVVPTERNAVNVDTAYGGRDPGISAFLSPVKGIKPLALSLSWMPFKFGRSIPTNEEVAHVDGPFHPEERAIGYVGPTMEADTRRLCAYPMLFAVDEQPDCIRVPRGFEDLNARFAEEQRENNEEFQYVLTGWERKKHNPEDEDQSSGEHLTCMSDNHKPQQCSEGYHVNNGFPGHLDGDLHIAMVHIDQPTGEPNSASSNDIIDGNPQESSLDGDADGFDYGDYHEEANELEAHKENINTFYNAEEYQYEHVSSPGLEFTRTTHSDAPFETRVFASPQRAFLSSEPISRSAGSIAGDQVWPISEIALQKEDGSVESLIGRPLRGKKWRKSDVTDVVSARDLFVNFIALRNKAPVPLPRPESSPDRSPIQPTSVSAESSPGVDLDKFVDQDTVLLPTRWINTSTHHRYLASITLIQKRAFVRELQSEMYGVILVERYSLGGVDIVIDPDHAILFAPLLGLQGHIETLSERILTESWRYSQLLVILEAYPSTRSSRLSDERSTSLAPCAYTPPNLRAIQRLRRILRIAEGCGSKDSRCSVIWAFADGVQDAAKFVRCFGDETEAKAVNDGHEVLWGDRVWLEEEEREGEADLAGLVGMNPFAAFVMLYHATLDDILAMSSESRLKKFGRLLRQERVAALNATIESRIREMGSDAEPYIEY